MQSTDKMDDAVSTSWLLCKKLLLLAAVFVCGCRADEKIDRFALVSRHHPVIHKADALTPLSVGNGGFCFTADITGLQTFTDFYNPGIPLCAQSYWGWHTLPDPNNYALEDIMAEYNSHGRKVKYAAFSSAQKTASEWLRANPHRLGLGRIGLKITKSDGSVFTLQDCTDIEQTLDLWSGILTSRFAVEGRQVTVETCCHPELDMIAVRICSDLIAEKRLFATLAFPYGSSSWGKDPHDWSRPERHATEIIGNTSRRIDFKRALDNDTYYASLTFSKADRFSETGKHQFELLPSGRSGGFEFSIAFADKFEMLNKTLPSVEQSQSAAKDHWKKFWTSGGAIDFSGSTDPRAGELERRIVLSQYLTAIQSAGPLPTPETGLTFNTWYGKPHIEMHWWHGVHFVLWGRPQMFEKSLPWYKAILPMAQKTAQLQGYTGARWPKMAGPDGREGPSSIAAFIIWQQPHSIYYAELLYALCKERRYLEDYKEVVFETAEFMASFVGWDDQTQRYVLGPPIMPAQEQYDPTKIINPTFELEYWRWGLETAQQWRQRLGMARNPKWDHVLKYLSHPAVKDGLYLAAESTPDTWSRPDGKDHPSMLFAYGMIPPQTVDARVMRQTLDKVLEKWNWPTTWGWDFPAVAMTAARLEDPQKAVDILMMDTIKNTYLANGHNYQNEALPIYLPGNAGLLSATAMMAAGWQGTPLCHAPGFPGRRHMDRPLGRPASIAVNPDTVRIILSPDL
jgi:protein-glucosylgalactosylhydroxylysine glucosidase